MPRATGCWPTNPIWPCQRLSSSRRDGGCDFAADPNRRGNEVDVVWLPKHNARLALITAAAPFLVDGPPLFIAKATAVRSAPEGIYVKLAALPFANAALLVDVFAADAPIALVLPLDELFDDRFELARRVYRTLVRRAQIRPTGFTMQRRRRLKLVLRALDGDLAGQDYRAIAGGLFGNRIPAGTEWRTHSSRSLTIRLVREGRALMRGDYLRLLRPDRRKR